MFDTIETSRIRFVLFENALDETELATLRSVCDALLDEPVDDGGGKTHRIGLGEKRRFLRHRHEDFADLAAFVLGDTIARISAACGLDDPMLFNEQFVVKGAAKGASFAWHQDGAYVGFDHKPYLTIWITLMMPPLTMGVFILPRNLDSHPDLDVHEWQDESGD